MAAEIVNQIGGADGSAAAGEAGTGAGNGTGTGPGGTGSAGAAAEQGAEEPSDTGFDAAFALHRGGKMAVRATVPVRDKDDLSLAYTPGVARVCSAIAERPELVHDYTWKSQVVAVVTDGTAVLGLGDIGPEASLPVMEGKAILFKQFGGVDAVPLALGTTDTDEIVDTVVRLAPSFGGVNLEDIAAPRCFEIERRLQERLDIPVFHDDQHGTAVVTLAALRNAAKLTGRSLGDLRAVISGAGAAGVAIAKFLLAAGVGDVAVADRKGIVSADRDDLTDVKRELAGLTNRAGLTGSLESALAGADVFIGVSGGTVPEAAVASMAPEAFVFAMANPDPEVHPDVAHRHAAVVATGRSDYPNQINNVLAFPGIFAGALQVRASRITEGMKIAAADALADVVGDELSADYVIPSPFDERVAPAVTAAVAAAARAEGVARR
ncbi:NAD(P)-dependent malic enzyme [Streptomyces sp. NRRL F-5135]|uniref:NAD(P)-dependent malic enzyme n=1 Tax=Streptomyces sp. NRRL F-5135 TaxID=1463858 RepID=UPI0004CBC171